MITIWSLSSEIKAQSLSSKIREQKPSSKSILVNLMMVDSITFMFDNRQAESGKMQKEVGLSAMKGLRSW